MNLHDISCELAPHLQIMEPRRLEDSLHSIFNWTTNDLQLELANTPFEDSVDCNVSQQILQGPNQTRSQNLFFNDVRVLFE